MQIKISTDYALRCVFYLSLNRQLVSAEKIGNEVGISPIFTRKILRDLKNRGIVESISGKNGGYRLIMAPEDIRIIDVFFTEEDISLIHSADEDSAKNWMGEEKSEYVHQYMRFLQNMVVQYFSSKTVADLLGFEKADTGAEKLCG